MTGDEVLWRDVGDDGEKGVQVVLVRRVQDRVGEHLLVLERLEGVAGGHGACECYG